MVEKANFEKEKNFISIVTYLKNNELEIEAFIESIDSLLNQNFISYEYIFVDDNSTDNTALKIKEYAKKTKQKITIISLAWNHKIELAMLAGVDMAIGDFVIEFDSPYLDFEKSDIMKIYNKCLAGYDVVAASPLNNISLNSKIFYKLLNLLSYRKMNLQTESFRIVSRRALNRVLSFKEKIRYRKAIYHYIGFNTYVYHYDNIKIVKKREQTSIFEKINLATSILINYSNIGIKIANALSILFLFFSFLFLVYTIVVYLTLQDIASGWTTTMLLLSIGMSGVFLVLTVLAKYVTSILNEVKDKPDYVYTKIDKY